MATDPLDPTIDGEISTLDPFEIPKGYELIGGELVEMLPTGFESSYVASRIYGRFDRFLEVHPIGIAVTAEASYRCFPGLPKQVRKPDVSVMLCDPKTFVLPKVNSELAPAVVVEVISPHDLAHDLARKVKEFLAAGTKLVWVIDPELREAYVHRKGRPIEQLVEPAALTGEDVLPGFVMPLADVLPPVL